MVKDSVPFDQDLLQKASAFLSSIKPTLNRSADMDEFLRTVGQGSPEPVPIIADSIVLLLSLPSPAVVKETLVFVRLCVSLRVSDSLTFLTTKIIPGALSSPHLRDLALVADQGIVTGFLEILKQGIYLFPTDKLYIIGASKNYDFDQLRNVVLHEMLIPVEPSLVQITRNRHLPSWDNEFRDTFLFLSDIIKVSAFHQPTLDFVCSSRLPKVFLSLPSDSEVEAVQRYMFWTMPGNISMWKRCGVECWRRGRRLLQTLEQEGFRDHLEQTLLHNNTSEIGKNLRSYSLEIVSWLGINLSDPI
ncbi:hypothetical protein BLNAU_10173 [Blattamonas nauphoetae]|uniref:Uncharacterized protein n=1 Tax=Blattamonas nauphoetae TaxID=2049346 RepID=A0ABQ9XTN3_9EUKA|nr:hypothetical protein BLNAU_10173 [Blattamonas nauphoetae]